MIDMRNLPTYFSTEHPTTFISLITNSYSSIMVFLQLKNGKDAS